MPKKTHCAACRAFVAIGDTLMTPDGEVFCAKCWNETCKNCEGCGQAVFTDTACVNPDGGLYCQSCFDRSCFTCHECGVVHWQSNGTHNDNSERICFDCFESGYFECADCGGAFSLEIANEYDYDYYCPDCAAEHNRNSGNFNLVSFAGTDDCAKVGSKRSFGVEIETSDCPDYMTLAGRIPFTAKDDCSVSGKEFASDILYGDDGLAAIEHLCKFAGEHGWRVNHNCGLHIHLDMRSEGDKALRAITAAYYLTYSVWKRFVETSRASNYYCGRSASGFNSLANASSFASFVRFQSRYEWFNIDAYRKFKTFEIRLHHGSIDAKEICNWIRAHTIFVDWAAKLSLNKVKDIMTGKSDAERFDFIAQLWIDASCEDLVDYYYHRGQASRANWAADSKFANTECAA